MLELLSERQEAAKSLLSVMNNADKSFSEGLLTSFPEEDNLVAVAVVMVELSREDRDPNENDLAWAMEFIDHLDTLGKRIVPK